MLDDELATLKAELTLEAELMLDAELTLDTELTLKAELKKLVLDIGELDSDELETEELLVLGVGLVLPLPPPQALRPSPILNVRAS